MARLSHQDLTAFSKALELLHADTGLETLPARVLACIRSLFHCDFVSYSSVDLRHARLHAFTLAPEVPDWPGMEVYQRYLRDDPAATHFMRTRDPNVVRMTDFVSLRQYRSTSVYTEVFRRTGCDRRLGFAMPNVGPVSMASTLNRQGQDFSDEERTLFNLLRPHLFQAHTQAHAHRLVHAELQRQRTNLGAVFGTGLGEVDEEGRIYWLTEHARALLLDFFPTGPHLPDRLPEALYALVKDSLAPRAARAADALVPLRRLVWRVPGPGERALRICLVAVPTSARWQLLLEEADDLADVTRLTQTLRLTRREAETLHWLKQGKTNWEIAQILKVAEKTVGKHLEHIYAKLGVENRTAAVHMAIEASLAG